MTRAVFISLLAGLIAQVPAADLPWKLDALSRAPQTHEVADAAGETGVRAVFFDSVPYQGRPTRVFAFYGMPGRRPGEKMPAMVLIHGGGGTAFAEWVRMWNQRGYAAIAMDTVGTAPKHTPGKPWNPDRARHDHSGPPGWGGFDKVDDPATDQWTYHAVAAAVLAHSLIRSFPEVDSSRIGVTGISWGGYLTSIVSGVDRRFRFAAPVYGCGFLGEDSAWLSNFEKLGPERAKRWLDLWDPSRYLTRARLPMLWVNGTNDFAYPLNSWQKSYRLTHGKRTLTVPVRMKHSHPDGAKPEEIFAYADSALRKSPPMTRVVSQGRDGSRVWAAYKAPSAPAKAELSFTRDTGRWQDRKWETVAADLDAKSRKATATLPEGARVYYFNLIDGRGLISSSEHVGN